MRKPFQDLEYVMIALVLAPFAYRGNYRKRLCYYTFYHVYKFKSKLPIIEKHHHF